ncbi:transcriptional adapter 3-B [Drosophila willistoni]|nr:transcriptional adapter 3-B [Drosophila willistoni]
MMSANMKNVKLSHFAGNSGSAGGSFNMSGGGGGGGLAGSAGAGGGKSGAASLGAGGSGADNDNFTTPSGVTIPFIRTRDVPKQLPTLAAALQRSLDEPLAAEDLDAVQLELELMLSNVALRSRVLKSEYENLDKDEKRRKLERLPGGSPPGLNAIGANGANIIGNGNVSHSTASSIGAKRKREEPTGVRKKHSSMTIINKQQAASAAAVGIVKLSKNSPMYGQTDDSLDYAPPATTSSNNLPPKVALPKNDMPNKFWLSVEPYCMPLTHEDLRLIDDLLEQYRGPLVPPIPTLGPHYSTLWSQEDVKSLQPGGSRIKGQGNASNMLKKGESLMEESITGPLTQRLVSALMEESLLTLPSEQAAVGDYSNASSNTTSTTASTISNSNENNAGGGAGGGGGAAPNAGNFRSLAMLKHGLGIEQRLKKELINTGLIESAEPDDVDEVLLEIKRVTAEISTISHFNSEELKRLRQAASEEIKRIELKRKLDFVDQEILECYKRMLQYRSKRKGHSLEEKQEILRLTNEQRQLAVQLEQMHPINPSGSTVESKM